MEPGEYGGGKTVAAEAGIAPYLQKDLAPGEGIALSAGIERSSKNSRAGGFPRRTTKAGSPDDAIGQNPSSNLRYSSNRGFSHPSWRCHMHGTPILWQPTRMRYSRTDAAGGRLFSDVAQCVLRRRPNV
jgi:hypothetical protein